jgi:hypothetical protein
MPLWMRVAALVAIAAWSIYAAIRLENRVLRRLTSAARGRARRALVLVTGYYVALVAVLGAFGVVAATVHDAGWSVVTTVVLLVGLAVTTPFMWILAPRMAESAGQKATSFADIRRRGASKRVARALAYPAVVYSFALLFPAVGATVFAVCVLE